MNFKSKEMRFNGLCKKIHKYVIMEDWPLQGYDSETFNPIVLLWFDWLQMQKCESEMFLAVNFVAEM